MATRVLTCVCYVVVRQEERAEKVEEGDDEEQPEEEGTRAEGQEAVSTPEDQGGDFLGASVSRIRKRFWYGSGSANTYHHGTK